jgi:hypothetical protein
MQKLLAMEGVNDVACSYLNSLGFDGDVLRVKAPRKGATKLQLTAPHTKKRIALI